MYIYFAFSALIYNPNALLSYDFYRRDGNFFITFLPLLLIPGVGVDFSPKKVTQIFIIFETITNSVFLILFYMGLLRNTNIYYFLFVAHNAAGGFLACMVALSLGFFMYEKGFKKIIYLICIVVNFVGIWETDSRGSIIGLLIAIFFVIIAKVKIEFKKHKIGLDVVLFMFLLAAIIIFEIYVYRTYGNNALGSNLEKYMKNNIFGDIDFTQKREWTIYERVFNLWPSAIEFFLASPVIGCGFGSYNDGFAAHKYVDGVLAWNYPQQYVYSDAHAHQSFLHIMAETGIVGLILTLLMLYYMRKSIVKIKDNALSMGLYIAFVVNVMSSFTEHRLFTPSQMIPYILILSMCLSRKEDSC
ncbi:MAG: O-antigen ligase family protein [Eubacterium sp.]